MRLCSAIHTVAGDCGRLAFLKIPYMDRNDRTDVCNRKICFMNNINRFDMSRGCARELQSSMMNVRQDVSVIVDRDTRINDPLFSGNIFTSQTGDVSHSVLLSFSHLQT